MRIAARASSFGFESVVEILSIAHRMETDGRDIVHLDLGEPDFPTPVEIVEAAERAIRDGYTHYTPAGGLGGARSAVAEHMWRSRGVEVSPQQVVFTSGSTQALLFSLLALVDEGCQVILTDPTYATYEALVRLAGGSAVHTPLREDGGFGLDLEELRSHLGPRTRVLLLNSPLNPTGGVLATEDLEAIAEIAHEHDLYVVSDEVYSDLCYETDRAPSIMSVPGMAERTVCVDSLSKTYAMCGWRLGYAVAPLDLARRLEAIMLAGGLCAPAFAQVAAIVALTSPASARAARAMRDEFRRRRNAMVEGINRIRGFACHLPAGAFYAFPDIRATGLNDRELARRLVVEGAVTTLPGSGFGSAGASHLRLSYAAAPDRIEEGLRRIALVASEAGFARDEAAMAR